MVYLYAGLGVAMLAGIMAIFEMGLSLTGRSLFLSPEDSYLIESVVKEKDRDILAEFVDQEVLSPNQSGLEICQALKEVAVLKDYFSSSAPEASGVFRDACVMNANSHRVLVQPNRENVEMPYRLYSCVLTGGEQLCLFEKEDDG